MKKTEMFETDYAFHTLLYRASIYARNPYLARKHRLMVQYYGSLLKYSQEKINRHIGEHQRNALAVRRRKEKAGVKYPHWLTKTESSIFFS